MAVEAVGALSLTEAQQLSTNTLQAGVIETIASSSPVLEMIPFMTISGNSYQYNQEVSTGKVAYRDVNHGYDSSSGTTVQKQESLAILGGDVDVDRFIAQTLGNVNNQRAIQTNLKAKAVAKEFTKSFFKGDKSKNKEGFDGLDVRIDANTNTIDGGSEALTLKKLHELLDAVDGGADVLFMSKAMRRELQALLEGQQHYIQVGKDQFGRPIEYFGNVQIRTVEDEILPFAPATGEDGKPVSDIYAVRFGAQEAISGLTNGGVMVTDLGELDTLPVYRTRIEFYVGMADFHPKSASRIKNIARAELSE